MMKEKYKIGTASKHSGVSPQTVRYYEKEDLFTSVKDETGSTRYYNARHLKWLSNIRRYFKCGFSEQEVHKLVHCQDLNDMSTVIDDKISETRQELHRLRSRIEALETFSYNVKRIDALLGRCVIQQNPALTFLIIREGSNLIHQEETEQILSRWLQGIQLTTLASIIPFHILTEEPDSAFRLSGHCVPAAKLDELMCSGNEPVLRTFQPTRCIHTVCKLTDECLSPKKILAHVYEYAADCHLRITGDAFGQVLAVLDEGACSRNAHPKAAYYEYWIPVGEI